MSAITAGEAYVQISVDDEELKEGLRNVSDVIVKAARDVQAIESKLSPTVKVEGAEETRRDLKSILETLEESQEKIQEFKGKIVDFSQSLVSSFGGVLSSFAKTGDELDKMAGRTGISAQALSEYGYAAQMCGASLDNIEDAVKSIATNLNEASEKGGEAADGFKWLGVSIEELKSRSPEEQFNTLARAVAGIDDPSRRAAVAMKVFGDAGQALLPFFSQGPEGIEKLKEEARDLGVSMTDSSATMAAEYTDAMSRISAATSGLKMQLAAGLAPAVTNAVNNIAQFVGKIISLSREYPRLTDGVIKTTAALAGTVAAITTLNTVVPICQKAFVILQAAMKAINMLSLEATLFGIVGAIAAVTAACLAYQALTKESGSYWSNEKQQALDAGDAMRDQDAERFRRLEELAAKESLTTQEIAEASRLAEELNQRYGDIGVSVDAVTKKINIAANAQGKMNAKMLDAKEKELEAAINEKKENAKNQNIAKKLAKEEVSWGELLVGKRRGDSWKSYFTDFEYFDNTDDQRLAILENDKNFQAKVKAAEAKNQSELVAMQAELDAIRANKNKPQENEESPEEKKAKEEARKKRESAEYDLEYGSASTEKKAQMSGAKLQEAEKALQNAKQGGNDEQIAEATRKYMSALRTYESDKDALDRENETKAKEQERQKAEEERQKQQEAEKQAKAKEDRQAAEDAYFDKNATLEERWNKSFRELQAAQQELTKAQEGGDDATIAAALRKLTGTQSKFESLDQEVQRQNEQYEEGMAEETTNAIQKKVESTGTFSAYQAQAWGVGMDGQRKLYEENKRQTEYLRRLVDLMGSSSSAFV